jgi:type IV secretory pathway VirB2 component (pilin)
LILKIILSFNINLFLILNYFKKYMIKSIHNNFISRISLAIILAYILPAFLNIYIDDSLAVPAKVTCTRNPTIENDSKGSCGLCKDGNDETENVYFTEAECALYYRTFGLNYAMLNASYNVSSNSFSRTICNALKIVTGSAGKTFAAFAIIAVGIGFFSGKVSWGLMIGVAAGIAAMFGAPSIVAAISGQNTDIACNVN